MLFVLKIKILMTTIFYFISYILLTVCFFFDIPQIPSKLPYVLPPILPQNYSDKNP